MLQLGELQATLKNLQGDATDFKSQIDQVGVHQEKIIVNKAVMFLTPCLTLPH